MGNEWSKICCIIIPVPATGKMADRKRAENIKIAEEEDEKWKAEMQRLSEGNRHVLTTEERKAESSKLAAEKHEQRKVELKKLSERNCKTWD